MSPQAASLVDVERGRPEADELLGQPVEIPLVVGDRRAVRLDQRVDGIGEILHRRRLEVLAVEDLIAAPVDHLALLVHHLVVLEDVLADLGVLRLDRGLGALDRLGDHLRLDRLVLVEASHRPVQRARGEQAHQLVVEAQVEAALAGVALAAGAATQLVVDPAALVALGPDHVQPAQLANPVALLEARFLQLGQQLVVAGERLGAGLLELLGHLGHRPRQREVVDHHLGGEALLQHLLAGQPLGVAAEQDVDTTTRHVGGDRDRTEAARLGDDLGLTRVLLGVEHLVLDAALVQDPRQQLALLDADRADEHRLALLVTIGDVVDDGAELARPRP